MIKLIKKLGLTFILTGAFSVQADALEDSLKPHLSKIFDTLTEQAAQSVKSCKTLEQSIINKASREDIDNQFKALLLDWKKVQAMYVLSEYDEDAIDLPHYIDVFHRSNEDLNTQMARAMSSDQPAKKALFKNSFKSINALEYVLYASKDKAITPRQTELSTVITGNICKRLDDVHATFERIKPSFLATPKKAVAVLMNELIDSSYKLKEWRLGDAAGVSRKRYGEPNEKYLEYGMSQLNVPTALAILSQHTAFTQPDSEFAKIITLLAEEDEIEEPIDALAHANKYTTRSINAITPLKETDLTNTNKIKPIYKTLNNLNDSYFVELIESLSDIVARVLDADGD